MAGRRVWAPIGAERIAFSLPSVAVPGPYQPIGCKVERAPSVADTWNFQVWYRDASPGLTSNFTPAVSVPFE